MKNNALQIITRASFHKQKFLSVLFCFFVVLSTVFSVITAGILFPLKNNVDTVLKQHVTLRRIIADFDKELPDDYIEDTVKELEKVEHITDVYELIGMVGVKNGNILKDSYYLDHAPIGGDLKITSGRKFDESESGVALVPEHINDLDEKGKKINEVDGNTLVGKTLKFDDDTGKTRKLKVVGAFSTFDPTLDDKTLLIPYSDLKKYRSDFDKMLEAQGETSDDGRSFNLVVDRAENAEETVDYITDNFTSAYVNDSPLNPDEFDTAIMMLILSLALFVALSAVGFYLFLKNNIDRRTSELALYRSLGYKSKHLFHIIFSEYMVLTLVSFAVGTVVVELLYIFVVNPYLDELIGGTLMEINLILDPIITLSALATLILIMYLVCRKAVKRSEKIDLTVLLRR